MPCLKNPRRERFAQLLASGKTATDAYELAGYKRSDSNGPALARTDEISGRVAEINGERLRQEGATAAVAAERAAVTRQSLVEGAQAIRKAAMEANQFSAAVAAHKEIGVLTGIRIERSERGAPGEFDWLEKLTIEELRLLAAGKLDIASYRKDEDAGRSRPN
jgi:phage terminase small subunit